MRYVFLRRGRIEVVSTYKYLAVIFDDFLEFDAGVKALAGGAGRGLGKIFSTHKRLHGMGYKTFTTMYEGMVDPIILYGAGVWGLKRFGCTEAVQNRAQRIFLGVHKYACNEAVNGDMGWRTVATKQKIWVLRLWNHLCEMEENRLCKKVFNIDHGAKKGWASGVKKLGTGSLLKIKRPCQSGSVGKFWTWRTKSSGNLM